MQKLIPLALLGLFACSSPGKVVVTTYGEDFIEKEIPAEEVEDGWQIEFSKFLVNIGEVKIASSDGEVGAEQTTYKVWNVKNPGPVTVTEFSEVPDRDFDSVSFAIAPSDNASAGNASASDTEFMKSNGYSVYVEGQAQKDAATKSFRWGFTTNTLYEKCGPAEGEPGITVPSGGELTMQLTLHGDHLFFDDLQNPDAKMRFDAMAAADADENGEITLAELAAVALDTLPAEQYGTGGVANVNDLRAFVTAQMHSLGHFQGEGECQPKSR